ncbi:MAG: hypothetical protein HUU10_04395 [Bacteroidetes bacterium]|nr:hypothetical protein [Bacteroidota bacterium]
MKRRRVNTDEYLKFLEANKDSIHRYKNRIVKTGETETMFVRFNDMELQLWNDWKAGKRPEPTPQQNNPGHYSVSTTPEDGYSISGGYYWFPIADGKAIKLTTNQIEELYKLYTVHGADYTSAEVLRATMLTPEAWNVVKGRLKLMKQSDILPPHLRREIEADSDQETQVYDRILAEAYEKKREKFTARYRDLWLKNAKELDRRSAEKDAYFLDHIMMLVDAIVEGKPKIRLVNYQQEKPADQYEWVMTFISDWHYGKIAVDRTGTEVYNEEIARERAERVFHTIAERYPGVPTYIRLLGDDIETAMEDGMHPDHRSHFRLSPHNQIKEAGIILAGGIISLSAINPVNVKKVGGNHDRVGKTRDEDKARLPSQLIHTVITVVTDQKDSKNIMVHPHDNRYTLDELGEIGVFCHHGDGRLIREKPADISLTYFSKKVKFLVIVTGHFHELAINMQATFATVRLPSLCGQDDHGDVSGYNPHTTPAGIVVIEKLKGISVPVIKYIPMETNPNAYYPTD